MASAATARADLEALLRARKLDRTVTKEAPAALGDGVPTGIASLDALLGGGLPRGEISEVTGPRSSGRGTLFQSILAAATGDGGLAALIDPLDMFDPPHAAGAGVVLARLLWVRGEACSAGRWDVLLDRGLKAVNLVLQAGGFDVVIFDLAEVPHDAIRRLPFTTWFRLQRAIEGGRTACLLTGPASISRSAGGVSIQLSRGNESRMAAFDFSQAREGEERAVECGVAWDGAAGFRRLAGLGIDARLLRARQPDSGTCRVRAVPS